MHGTRGDSYAMNEDASNDDSRPGSRFFARNAMFNLAGYGVPFIAALIAVPLLVRGLGIERFGLLTLAWMITGYFGLFDLGISRAVTKYAADLEARGERTALRETIGTAMGMLLGLGAAAAVLVAAAAPFLSSLVLETSSRLHAETTTSFIALAAAIPFMLGSAGARGVLEAQQRFGLLNAIRIPIAIASTAGPLAIVPHTQNLFPIALVLLIARIIEFAVFIFILLRLFPGLRACMRPRMRAGRLLLGYGGWLTVTNIVGPVMTYLDRFIVSGLLGATAAAFYATPYDVVSRLAVIPGSLLGAVFPALAAAHTSDEQRFTALYKRTRRIITLLMTPLVLLIILGGGVFLNVWLGPAFAEQGTSVLRLLALGMLVNAIGQVPYGALHAMGRPDITAKLHLVELPLFLGMIWVFTHTMGITGAALAWFIRALFDTTVLTVLAERRIAGAGRRLLCAQSVRS